ncbi:MAG: hypothetical protein AAGB11_01735 [Pseudomonadota bacterium]
MTLPRLLVTGFGPFPGVPDNPSARLVEWIDTHHLPGVKTTVLPTEWSISEDVADLARSADGVIMFGVATNSRHIRYERISHSVASDARDAAGNPRPQAPVHSRRTDLPATLLVEAARKAGFPVRLSHSAGTYICNTSYGAALSANRRALFVHIPQPCGRSTVGETALNHHALWLIAALQVLLFR